MHRTNVAKASAILIAIAAVPLLPACGGGGSQSGSPALELTGSRSGGGGSPTTLSASSLVVAVAPNVAASASPRGATPGSLRRDNAEQVLDALTRLADQAPEFPEIVSSDEEMLEEERSDAHGGPTQSESGGTATAVFGTDGLTLSIPLDGERTAELSEKEHTFATVGAASPVTGHTGQRSTLFSAAAEEATFASVLATHDRWETDEPDDWLAAGSWLRFSEGDEDSARFEQVEAGAFVQGPEFAAANALPRDLEGGAHYTGRAEGLYAYRYGSEERTPSRHEVGEYFGTATLAADFGSQTVEGCIGCEDGITISGVEVGDDSSPRSSFSNVPTAYRIRLGAASFDMGGTFQEDDATVENPITSISSSNGHWGGRFSSAPDGAGVPRLVAGTVGVEFAEADGSEGAFAGPYIAASTSVPWQLAASNALQNAVEGGSPSFLYGLGEQLEARQEDANAMLLTEFHPRGPGLEAAEFNELDEVVCRRTVCLEGGTIRWLSDFEFSWAEYRAILVDNGITLVQLRQEEPSVRGKAAAHIPDALGYGAWLEHSAFLTLAGPLHLVRSTPVGDDSERVFGLSFGSRSDSAPTGGSARWRGTMTGTDMVLDHAVQGDVEMEANFGQRTVDVVIDDITDLETLAPLLRPDLPLTSDSENALFRWSSLAMKDDGAFADPNDTIEGRFYGPNHEEAGGIFQHHGIVGAFGAKRQTR